MSAQRCWVDGRAGSGVPADDRGLAYGDGLFETVLVVEGRPVWWEAHLDRLEHGAAVLGIVAPARGLWWNDLLAARAELPGLARGRWVARLTLTRGSGPRGYALRAPMRPRRILALAPAPACADAARHGLRLRWCRTALAVQPALAGLKHLNRLEQVLARQEWNEPGIDEGLMCDTRGAVVSAISANLLCLTGRGWVTPPVTQAGVAGVCRRMLLENGWVGEGELRCDEVDGARALAVCNSVRGILPVRQLGTRGWGIEPELRALQRRLAAIEPAFHHPFLDDELA
ncbi:MAG: aminodeoxychorismate lyase [Lysobacteraceae bacterium]|nr:MAG: aminodeoxychorismate lyase [Xanthomonadaceae bacterium]